MSRAAAVLVLVILAAGGAPAGEPADLGWEGLETVDGLRLADVDADGRQDVLLLAGHEVAVWRGREGALPAGAPTWRRRLPESISFVDARPGSRPAVLAVGRGGPRVLALDGKAADDVVAGGGLGWRDAERAVVADLVRPGGVLVPDDAGWTWHPDGAAPWRLALTRYLDVRPPGPFLEDTCTVVHALPAVVVGAGGRQGSDQAALWALDGTDLVAQGRTARTTWDLSFLGAGRDETGDQTLVDLDGDGRPDLLHRLHTNRQARYGFFRTRPAAADASVGPGHQPPTSSLLLSGFTLDPEFVDLDGDGLLDLVVTGMQINAPNMIRALRSGQVTAQTHAFLNRWGEGKGRFFADEPDAVIQSPIEVGVQFNYAGNVEVVRSFTILVDGDFDGDGRKDLAIRTTPDTITIRPGRAAGVWAGDDVAWRVAIPPKGEAPDVDAWAGDVDGDGRDELVLVHRKAPGGRDRVRVVDPRP